MATGVSVADDVISQYNDFKLHKEPFNHRFYTYRVDGSHIVIDQVGPKDSTWADFVDAMPPNECRYGLFDLEYQSVDGRPTGKLVFIAWAPDTAKVKDKMVFAGSKDALKSALVGVGVHLQATDQSELDLESCIIPQLLRV